MKKILSILALAALAMALPMNAGAADYTFRASGSNDFHRPTTYEEVFGSSFNYGGHNVVDFRGDPVLPGLFSPTQQPAGGSDTGAQMQYGLFDHRAPAAGQQDIISHITSETAFTPTGGLRRADGSIGTLAIPSLSINMRAFEGTTQESMRRGLGHFPETSGWEGNIGLAGHNRSAAHAIGAIRNLGIGDTIRYTTVHGTRTYAVTFVGTISATDWSHLGPTHDNRITLVTCLANQPSLRVVVQAAELG